MDRAVSFNLSDRSLRSTRHRVGSDCGADRVLPLRRRGDRVKRREFITLVGVAAALPLFAGASAPFAAAAQKDAKLARLAYLSSHPPERFRVAVFRETLAALGWRERENLIIDYASADGQFDQLPRLARELVKRGPDAIFAAPAVSALAAKRATETIPII